MKKNLWLLSIVIFILQVPISCSKNKDITENEEEAGGTNTQNNEDDSSTTVSTNSKDTTFANAVTIVYSSGGATITNPYSAQGVTVTTSGADVIVESTISGTEINYVLQGSSSDGSLKIYSDYKFGLGLNGVDLINNDGPAINIQSKQVATVVLTGGTTNRLIDNNTYATSTEDQKGTFFSEGNLLFHGSGTLSVKGYYKHGIVSDGNIEVSGGAITITSSYVDGVHAKNNFVISNGSLSVTSTGDGIEAEEGTATVSGGSLNITSTADDVKAFKSAGNINVSGGTVTLTVSGAQSKGFKTDADAILSGGAITIKTSGSVALNASGKGYDPSYCTGIKTEGNIMVNGAAITITSIGASGKGISADGNFTINSGTVIITTSGDGAKYTTTTGATDSYSATCISVDGATYLYGGTLNLSSSGSAGKGISSDGALVIGQSASTAGPALTVKTTGAKFLVSGSGQNADYANPKAVKSDAAVTVNSGTITLSTTQDGGEGLESKSNLVINGGTLDIQSYDDCINASTSIVINGGTIYCYSSGNDGIDSNGTLTVTGGLILSSGTTSPEEGFDCDNNTFKITGGILIGTGGATSTPTASVSTQRSVIYGASASANQVIRIQTSTGTEVATFKVPRTYNSMTLLFSSPAFASGTTYQIYTGGSVSGGTDFHGYYTGATYTAGTLAQSFTPTSMVTTVGSTSSGPGGGR